MNKPVFLFCTIVDAFEKAVLHKRKKERLLIGF